MGKKKGEKKAVETVAPPPIEPVKVPEKPKHRGWLK